jgi:putative PIN family toxin of toxin-antitoxin system
MIIVLDPNVIISAILSPRGNPAAIIRRWEADEFEVATSPELVKELRRALSYGRVMKHLKLSTKELSTFLGHFQSIVVNVSLQEILEVMKNDPDDNRILECALEASATIIVSGDRHLLNLKEYRGIEILPPAGFLAMLELEKGKPS